MHFWVGSYCLVARKDEAKTRNQKPIFPGGVVSVFDTLTIVADMANNIPDKSWMLYLLEIFNSQDIVVELNLICQFDGQDYFEAIFRGVNQYRFKRILPVVGHSYNRQILLDSQSRTIRYILTDKNIEQYEIFDLPIKNTPGLSFEGSREFSGIEWWNKMRSSPYPIKYEVEISQLSFGLNDDPLNGESIIYFPYNALMPNNDGSTTSYPISLKNLRIKDDGCISYDITHGSCYTGIRYNC
jgi:hypothetical protein